MNKTIVFAAVTLFALAMPVGVAVYRIKKHHAKIWPMITGAFCFTVFAMVLERLLHSVCLMGNNSVSRFITGSTIAYALYGGFAAGIFEECARLFAFKVLLRKRNDPETSIAYGIGHGGIECILLLGVTYLIYTLALCGVSFGSEETNSAILSTISAIDQSLSPVACIERVAALILQIGLSILVFNAVHRRKYSLLILAILIHAATDIPAVFYQTGQLPIWTVELWCAIIAIGTLYFAARLLRNYSASISKNDFQKVN